MEDALELGLESLDRTTSSKHFDKYIDKGFGQYDRAHGHFSGKHHDREYTTPSGNDKQDGYDSKENEKPRSAVAASNSGRRHTRNTLPSPERDEYNDRDYPQYSDRELEVQSQTSERVLRAYESERDDPKRKPHPSIVGSTRSRNTKMSHSRHSRSQGRYDDDDSDYDERSGRRVRSTGRGYDPNTGREFDREVVETERYRGPPRDWEPRGNNHLSDPWAAGGAVALRDRDRDRDSKSHSRHHRSSRSRSSSRSRTLEGPLGEFREKVDEQFDTSLRGAGVALAGAVVGGLIGKQLSGGRKDNKRDMALGGVIGGLGANWAENKWQEKQGEKKEKRREGGRYREEERYERDSGGRDRSRGR